MCDAEAVFCYTAENSHHLEAQVTSKNPQFQEEKISARRRARSHITTGKSSKNYISLFGGKPARGLPTPPPTPPQRKRIFNTWKMWECDGQTQFPLAGLGRGELGGGRAKRCYSLMGQRINCKLKTKIANTILLLCYLDKMCLSPSGGLWQASALLYSEQSL